MPEKYIKSLDVNCQKTSFGCSGGCYKLVVKPENICGSTTCVPTPKINKNHGFKEGRQSKYEVTTGSRVPTNLSVKGISSKTDRKIGKLPDVIGGERFYSFDVKKLPLSSTIDRRCLKKQLSLPKIDLGKNTNELQSRSVSRKDTMLSTSRFSKKSIQNLKRITEEQLSFRSKRPENQSINISQLAVKEVKLLAAHKESARNETTHFAEVDSLVPLELPDINRKESLIMKDDVSRVTRMKVTKQSSDKCNTCCDRYISEFDIRNLGALFDADSGPTQSGNTETPQKKSQIPRIVEAERIISSKPYVVSTQLEKKQKEISDKLHFKSEKKEAVVQPISEINKYLKHYANIPHEVTTRSVGVDVSLEGKTVAIETTGMCECCRCIICVCKRKEEEEEVISMKTVDILESEVKKQESCSCLPGLCTCPGKVKAEEEKKRHVREMEKEDDECICYHEELHLPSPASSVELSIEPPCKPICVCRAAGTEPYIEPTTFPCVCSTYQRTLAIIRPDAMQYKDVVLRAINQAGLIIVNERTVHLTPEQASEIYEHLYGSPTYPSIILNMCRIPVLVMSLCGSNAVDRFKLLVSPYGSLRAEWFYPSSVAHRFGLHQDMDEAIHASQTIEKSLIENRFFFPQSVLEPVISEVEQVEDYCTKYVHPTLLQGLAIVATNKPADPLLFLATWLLMNNPHHPNYDPLNILLART